ncbi:MAG: hypothetical protein JXA14_00615 [Anaerolineae bacterium]|nr:hypothetical protein [Anaerolineae bacterium]
MGRELESTYNGGNPAGRPATVPSGDGDAKAAALDGGPVYFVAFRDTCGRPSAWPSE